MQQTKNCDEGFQNVQVTAVRAGPKSDREQPEAEYYRHHMDPNSQHCMTCSDLKNDVFIKPESGASIQVSAYAHAAYENKVHVTPAHCGFQPSPPEGTWQSTSSGKWWPRKGGVYCTEVPHPEKGHQEKCIIPYVSAYCVQFIDFFLFHFFFPECLRE